MKSSERVPELKASPVSESIETLQGSAFISRVFAWMALGLLTTAGIAWWFAATLGEQVLIDNPWIFLFLMFSTLALVFVLSAKIKVLPHGVAVFMFLLYAGLNGAFLSAVVATYTTGSIAVTFGVTSAMFGSMAFLGTVLKMDLTKFGSIFLMALIGLIIGSIINMIWFNETIYWILTGAGILIFCGLTAYDMQRIKLMAQSNADSRFAIAGALALYLDFINMFLFLLRIFGRR